MAFGFKKVEKGLANLLAGQHLGRGCGGREGAKKVLGMGKEVEEKPLNRGYFAKSKITVGIGPSSSIRFSLRLSLQSNCFPPL